MANQCPECKRTDGLFWEVYPDTNSGIVDGRLRMHDIKIKAFQGCEFCSCTIEIIGDEEINSRLSKTL